MTYTNLHPSSKSYMQCTSDIRLALGWLDLISFQICIWFGRRFSTSTLMGGDFKTIMHVYQYVLFLLNDNKSISSRHMKVVFTRRLYGYMYTNTINKGRRDVIICKQKIKKRNYSVQRAPVNSASRCSYFIDKKYSSIIMLIFNTIRFKTDLCVYFGF